MRTQRNFLMLSVLLITAISFLYRIKGISINHPFWVDEFATGVQSNLLLEHGLSVFSNPSIFFEKNHFIPHVLTALSFTVFGPSEWAARILSVIAGSLVPIMIYFVSKELFNKLTGLVSALLYAFSYFMILWATQARGYILHQLLLLLTLYAYARIYKKKTVRMGDIALIVLLLLTGLLIHVAFYLLILALITHLIVTKRKWITTFVSTPKGILVSSTLFVLFVIIFVSQNIASFFTSSFFGANNLWYYHSFLWREHGLITFLSLLGFSIVLFKKPKESLLIIFPLLTYLIFFTFGFAHYLTKYLVPIFPLLLIGAGVFITEFGEHISSIAHVKKNHKSILRYAVPLLITIFIISQGNNFVRVPKNYYTLNEPFREISNIDYDQIYSIIESAYNKNPNIAVIDTWPARTNWYLGNGFNNLYLFRWENEEGFANGHSKKTTFTINSSGEKEIRQNLGFVGTREDLERVINSYPQGFIFIDDSSLPQDVIRYAEVNLKKELYLDHYPLDPNPLSIWPATLYSWGVE